MEIPDHVIAELRQLIADRNIGGGLSLLEKCADRIELLGPRQKNAAAFLGYLAQWVDIGFGNGRLVRKLLDRFPRDRRESLPLSDYAHLRMAEGLVAMLEEEFDKAVGDFEKVVALEEELHDRQLVSITHFWIGRCRRREGHYDEALSHTAIAREMAMRQKLPRIAAVMRILEAWIVFQQGRSEEAMGILAESEAVLRDTDDYVTLGNIQSAYGRIERRRGRYHQALQYFTKAIAEYKKRNPRHRNLARSLVNIAFVKRLIALDLRSRIDRDVARRRRTKKGGVRPGSSRRMQDWRRYERLQEQAMAHLEEAGEIYRHYDDHRGLGTVQVNSGYLHLDHGELDRAKREGETAYRLGAEKQDYILRARARVLEAAVERAKFEEQVEDGSERGHPAQLAADLAREAVECAKHTENRRLLARAYIELGMTLCNEFFQDTRAAQECAEHAAALLSPENRDALSADLQKLKAKLLRAGGIDQTLREWSQGAVGEKTFQQISEEFAGIVISKVWLREGRKVSRVAEKLSISPKKVRRVLRNMGFLKHG
jgi:tetratricopeptide (TPR) repeat protein